jgi:hypothetical protein
MKKVIINIGFALAISAVLISCSKQESNEASTPAATTTQTNTTKAPASVVRFSQEEVFFNECCGEVVTLNYTVTVISNGNGWRASLNQLSGIGSTSGNEYHGANTQGLISVSNNETYTFSTLLVSQDASSV